MHVTKNDLPVKIDAPGAHARHLRDFGVASGALAAEYFTMGAGADLAPLLQGLEHDACHSAHWGFMVAGEVVVTYNDGSEERCAEGDVFHWPAGHSVRVEADAELVMFSPQAEHTPVLDHIVDKMAAA
jgi:mannose-6-phosphate isomerase-like protein (cupin superfamily)